MRRLLPVRVTRSAGMEASRSMPPRMQSRMTSTVLRPPRSRDTVPPASSRAGQQHDQTVYSWKAYAMFTWLAGMIMLASWLIVRLSGLRREHCVSSKCHPGPRAGIQGETVWMPDQVRHDIQRGFPNASIRQLQDVAAKTQSQTPAAGDPDRQGRLSGCIRHL